MHRQSAYLFGRERKVADIPIDHPSCSSQHAVLQYRQVEVPNTGEGEVGNRIVIRCSSPGLGLGPSCRVGGPSGGRRCPRPCRAALS